MVSVGKHRRNIGWLAAVSLLAALSCRVRREPPPEESAAPPSPAVESVATPASAAPAAVEPPPPPEPVVVPEGAALAAIAASPNAAALVEDLLLGAGRASDAAMQSSPLDAVAEAVIALERSGRFPAGLGAAPRTDGVRLLDAVLMDEEGAFSGVAGVSRLASPMEAAQSVAKLRSALLIGDGAVRFAQSVGIELVPEAPLARPSAPPAPEVGVGAAGAGGAPPDAGVGGATVIADAGAADSGPAVAPTADAGPPPAEPAVWSADGVAAVVRTADGRFGAAASAGGGPASMPGEITWFAAPGRGIYASSKGAVAVVGSGLGPDPMARRIHDRMVAIGSPKEAARWALAIAPEGAVIGVIAIDARSVGIASAPELSWVERSAKGDRTSVPAEEQTP